jgi:hypothetical protein
MIIDAYATDTVPSYEVRRRALEALANEGEPMSEVTYDALRKRLAQAAAEIEKLRAKYGDLEKELGALRVALKKISVTARRKDETPEALLMVCDAIARAPWGEGP